MIRNRIVILVVALFLMTVFTAADVAARGDGARFRDGKTEEPGSPDEIIYRRYLPIAMRQTCSNIVVNGGFEVDASWEIPITEYSAGYSTDRYYTGSRSMRTGVVYPPHNRYSYSDTRQQVHIVDDTIVTVNVRLWRMSDNPEAAETLHLPAGWKGMNLAGGTFPDNLELDSGDVQYILILDEYQNWIDTLLWQRKDIHQWTYLAFDLSYYAGEIIYLQFGTYNDGYDGVSSMYVDDVSVNVCNAP